MIHPQMAIQMFAYTVQLINKQCDGMSDADSLQTPPFQGNCINWILGHMVSSRSQMLLMLGEQPVWDDATRQPYRNGSPNITAEMEGVLPLATLLEAFNETQRRLAHGLAAATYEDLSERTKTLGANINTVVGWIAYFQFHEAHHAGQITMIAPMVGKAGVWIA
jgi:uncharacterized damage-inducible protein DinB